jgi:hypothetical protein
MVASECADLISTPGRPQGGIRRGVQVIGESSPPPEAARCIGVQV